jgi:hypothetical protein
VGGQGVGGRELVGDDACELGCQALRLVEGRQLVEFLVRGSFELAALLLEERVTRVSRRRSRSRHSWRAPAINYSIVAPREGGDFLNHGPAHTPR